MIIEDDVKLNFVDVLIKPKRSTLTSRADVILEREFKFKYHRKKLNVIPIFASNMDATGTFEMEEEFRKFNMLVCIHKFYSVDTIVEKLPNHPNTFYTMGITEKDYEKFSIVKKQLSKKNFVLDKICIDVANGYMQKFVDFVKRFRDENPDSLIMAGNVCTGEITEELVLSGADIVKIGIGGGSVCTTRNIAGVGIPQLSAIIECADAAHGLDGHICSDGGIKEIADFSKAFCAGADFVMAGSMFAGHDECNCTFEWKHVRTEMSDSVTGDFYSPKKVAKFYGMSSYEAMNKYYEKIGDYRASEGKVIYVPYKGKVENTIREILGGIRSCMTYIGARRLKEMPKRATFVKVHSIK